MEGEFAYLFIHSFWKEIYVVQENTLPLDVQCEVLMGYTSEDAYTLAAHADV